MIQQVYEKEEKQELVRKILEALPEWFGIPEAREDYIKKSASQVTFAAFLNGQAIGFLCLEETGKDTVELYVMGVLKEYQGQGTGKKLVAEAKAWAALKGYSFMQVKTVQMGKYKEYDATNYFYRSLGFKEFEVIPTLWDAWNPCQIYAMYLQ